MADPMTERKARFKAALTRAKKTLKQWAEDEGVTPQHVHMVLSGVRESASLVERIDDFSEKWSKRVAA